MGGKRRWRVTRTWLVEAATAADAIGAAVPGGHDEVRARLVLPAEEIHDLREQAGKPLPAIGQQVYVLAITNGDETWTTTHASDRGAWEELARYVRRAWDESCEPRPADDREAITQYFKQMTEDSYRIDRLGVRP